MDWTAYKKILLDEYREDYPDSTKEEEMAFYTAMTWLENDFDLDFIKQKIIDSLEKENPDLDKKVRKAFVHGLNRMGLVINEMSSVSDRLNDYIPEKRQNEYLRKTLEGVKELVVQNDTYKTENEKMSNYIKSFMQMTKTEKYKARLDHTYILLNNEINQLKDELKRTQNFRDALLSEKLLNNK